MDQNAEIGDIKEIVERDPGLVIKLLAVANSAYFGQSTDEGIGSLDEALMRLGSNEIIRLVGMLAFQDTTAEGLPLYGMGQKELTQLSVYTAMLMAHFATNENCRLTPGECYTLGLIRSLGHWFIQRALREQNISVRPYLGSLMEAHLWEEDLLRINHAEFAVNTLRQYRMPGKLLDPLAHYLRPHLAENTFCAHLLLSCTEQALRDFLPARLPAKSELEPDWYLHYTSQEDFDEFRTKSLKVIALLI